MAHIFLACPARILGESATFLGRPDEAAHWYERAIEIAGRISFRPEVALAHARLGELQLKHYPDERADALAHLDFAIPEFEAMGMQPALERASGSRGRRRTAREAKEPIYADGLTRRGRVLRLIAAGRAIATSRRAWCSAYAPSSAHHEHLRKIGPRQAVRPRTRCARSI
jgi:hypothetical protein